MPNKIKAISLAICLNSHTTFIFLTYRLRFHCHPISDRVIFQINIGRETRMQCFGNLSLNVYFPCRETLHHSVDTAFHFRLPFVKRNVLVVIKHNGCDLEQTTNEWIKRNELSLLQNRWRYYKIFHELTGILKKIHVVTHMKRHYIPKNLLLRALSVSFDN